MERIEQEVAESMAELFQLKQTRRDQVGDLVREREMHLLAVEALDHTIAEKCKDVDAVSAALEEKVKGLALRLEQSVSTRFGRVKFVSGYERETYDSKGLSAQAQARSERAWVLEYRARTPVLPRVSVEVYESSM